MSENEKELLSIIRENDNPEQAMLVAVEIILGYLKRHESSGSPSSAGLREPCGTGRS